MKKVTSLLTVLMFVVLLFTAEKCVKESTTEKGQEKQEKIMKESTAQLLFLKLIIFLPEKQ